MGSLDLRRTLAGWPYESNQITVRKIAGDDGSVKIQMRLPLGVLQMEVAGRPDGERPYGFESLLDHHDHRLKDHVRRNGTELGFELGPDECQSLRDEAVMYYHRYLSEFVLEDFDGVERDSARNLRVLDMCRRFGQEENDRVCLEQYRPYLIMMNTRAKAHLALRQGNFKTALAHVNAGLKMIHNMLSEVGQTDLYDELTEVAILITLRDEIAARVPMDPMERLERDLRKAVREERYEEAADIRNRMAQLRARKTAPVRRRRPRS